MILNGMKNKSQDMKSKSKSCKINNTSIISEENNNNTKTFEALNIKQKVILLMFFCNYCMSFSGRQPLYLEEIMTNTEDNFINNKKILPLFFDKEGFNNYIFPLNKDEIFARSSSAEPIITSSGTQPAIRGITRKNMKRAYHQNSDLQALPLMVNILFIQVLKASIKE